MRLPDPILVTGGRGFIGRRLLARLTADGAKVIAPPRNILDLADSKVTTRVITEIGPSTVIHLASDGVEPERADGPALVVTEFMMLVNLLASLQKGTRLVIAGTMAEYGRNGRLAEDDPATPHTAYGLGKLAATLHALAEAPRRGVAVTVARLFGVYGPGEAPHRLFPVLRAALSERRPIQLSDGTQRRDFVHVDDVVDILLALARHPAPPTLINVGTGKAIAVRTACERFADAMGADRALLAFGEKPRRSTDEDLLEADTARLVATFGAAPPQRLVGGRLPVLF